MRSFLDALAHFFPNLLDRSTCHRCGGQLQLRVDGRRCPDCGHLYARD